MRLLPTLLCAGFAPGAPATVKRPSPATIHKGLYAIPGGVREGRNITKGYGEQIMPHASIPKEQYAALAKEFNPAQPDTESVVKPAKDGVSSSGRLKRAVRGHIEKGADLGGPIEEIVLTPVNQVFS